MYGYRLFSSNKAKFLILVNEQMQALADLGVNTKYVRRKLGLGFPEGIQTKRFSGIVSLLKETVHLAKKKQSQLETTKAA